MSTYLQSITSDPNIASDIYKGHAVFYCRPPMDEDEFLQVKFTTQGGDMEYFDEGGPKGVWIEFNEYVAGSEASEDLRERVVNTVIEDLKAHRARKRADP